MNEDQVYIASMRKMLFVFLSVSAVACHELSVSKYVKMDEKYATKKIKGILDKWVENYEKMQKSKSQLVFEDNQNQIDFFFEAFSLLNMTHPGVYDKVIEGLEENIVLQHDKLKIKKLPNFTPA